MNKQELLSVADCKTNKTISKGTYLFKEGTQLNGVFCIKSGICKLVKLSSNGKHQIVKFIKKGDLLGQRSLISDEAVSLSAIAIEEMEVCFVPRSEILSIFKNNQAFSADIINDICYDLKMANDSVVNMAQKPVKARFSRALLDLKQEFGVDNNGFLQISLSREEFANVVGTATESMIRMISDFSKKDLIATEGKKIKVVNDVKLEQLAEDL
ncbi:Crp/Fnr family transcriptional regulator [Galbibacter sp. BG1]|uniref:Crp/Fnr family transcriptional regulator n=1 Tax=Galbibacter sp. BG1 TaxID=1170699 RepID=UPI00293BDA52|nr:Crp/Fnr family transcriptional regulator [Galbibacter sp. BG1]